MLASYVKSLHAAFLIISFLGVASQLSDSRRKLHFGYRYGARSYRRGDPQRESRNSQSGKRLRADRNYRCCGEIHHPQRSVQSLSPDRS